MNVAALGILVSLVHDTLAQTSALPSMIDPGNDTWSCRRATRVIRRDSARSLNKRGDWSFGLSPLLIYAFLLHNLQLQQPPVSMSDAIFDAETAGQPALYRSHSRFVRPERYPNTYFGFTLISCVDLSRLDIIGVCW